MYELVIRELGLAAYIRRIMRKKQKYKEYEIQYLGHFKDVGFKFNSKKEIDSEECYIEYRNSESWDHDQEVMTMRKEMR